MMRRLIILFNIVFFLINFSAWAQLATPDSHFWIGNALNDHRFSVREAAQALGVNDEQIHSLVADVSSVPSARWAQGPFLKLLPYPGGRHPRIGFLDGAINPDRGTKASLFAPWDPHAYVVIDLPEAIFSNLGLLFLAHTHIPTIWEERGIPIPSVDWTRNPDGSLEFTRVLPNRVSFGSKIVPTEKGADMDLWLTNGTNQTLTGLRTQVCVMLKGLPDFEKQTLENKIFHPPLAIARNDDSQRYLLTAWERCGRSWGNDRVPCIHSDPVFPDCSPGETVRLRGVISFAMASEVDWIRQKMERGFSALEK